MKVQIDYDGHGDISKKEVLVDEYDCLDADYTLAMIILPVLKKIRENKQWVPHVDDEDVPEEIRSTAAKPKEDSWDIDEFHFNRWEHVLNEMIWAFEDHTAGNPDADACYEDINEPAEKGSIQESLGLSKTKVNLEKLKAYKARKQNAFCLFGKYYHSLWMQFALFVSSYIGTYLLI